MMVTEFMEKVQVIVIAVLKVNLILEEKILQVTIQMKMMMEIYFQIQMNSTIKLIQKIGVFHLLETLIKTDFQIVMKLVQAPRLLTGTLMMTDFLTAGSTQTRLMVQILVFLLQEIQIHVVPDIIQDIFTTLRKDLMTHQTDC